MKTPARILFLDIETAPNLGWVWGKWQQDVIEFKQDWYILSIGWKWADESEVHVIGLDDGNDYTPGTDDDSFLVAKLWDLFNEADIIIAHNGDNFDIPKVKTRFISQGFAPPSPYKTVDTLQIARKHFKFDSNKLDELGRYLKIGRKLPHTGFDLWKRVMLGQPDAWTTMKKYNAHDIELLEEVYYLMRAWHPSHPNVNKGEHACPKCGSFNVQKRGFSFTAMRKKQRLQCSDCTGWFEGPAKAI